MKVFPHTRWTIPLLAALLALGCGMKAPSNSSKIPRSPKRGFEKPAGAYNVTGNLPESVREYTDDKDDKAEEDAVTVEEAAPMADAATQEAPALAKAAPAGTNVRTEPAPDLAPHLRNGEGQLVTDVRAGMPGFMLSPGSASEAEVRAERLHRMLLQDPPAGANATVVAVKVRPNSLAVFIEVPMSSDPSLGELTEIARSVVEKTAKAIPEATDPDKAVEIEVHAGKHHMATWKAGTWELTPPPQSPLKN